MELLFFFSLTKMRLKNKNSEIDLVGHFLTTSFCLTEIVRHKDRAVLIL